jgi:serine/threonine-protein kinase
MKDEVDGDEPTAELGDAKTRVLAKAAAAPRARRCPECGRPFSGEARFCPFDGDPLVDAPDWNPSQDPLIGAVVEGRYEVLRVLGEGGMGTVYEVRHNALGRSFAMKVLRREVALDAGLARRFMQEAKAAAAIGHPNIVAVSDFGELVDGPLAARVPFFVMELLKGTSLAKLLAVEGRLAPARAARIVAQCASALDAAHDSGVVHRDMKPDNIFLVAGGGREEFVKLLDFGVAKMAGAGRLTRHGTVYGTPHYMSPEQAAGHEIDGRTDVYALGIVLYECLAGRVPFEADTYMGVLTKHMFAKPEPIERLVPDASGLGALGQVVARCLAKEPGDRYASMRDLVAALERAVDDPEAAATAELRDERPTRSPLRLRDPNEPGPRRREPQPADDDAVTMPPVDRLLSVGLGMLLAVAAAALAGLLLRAGSAAPLRGVDASAAAKASASVAVAPSASASAPEVVDPSATASTASAATTPSAAPVVASSVPSSPPGAAPTPKAPRASDVPAPTAPKRVRPEGPRGGGDVVDPWGK